MDYARLSKTVSHALRHSPEQYGLQLDASGWVSIDSLLASLRPRSPGWTSLEAADHEIILELSTKKWFEISEGKIRALYGHSTPERIEKERGTPPEMLFHGTDPAAAAIILEEGLKNRARQYAHLSLDCGAALEVGRRKGGKPVILAIRAREASDSGIAFYQGNDLVWLADFVPPAFISPFPVK